MRFARLTVESFRSIRRADIELIPGLNIIYGPNDLGKSTLAAAVRAALLVVPGSSEDKYDSWHSAESPRVELTFVDPAGHYWRVGKTFGSSPSAELLHSKDGVTFTRDCKGRQVEEKLRTMLAWGIPAPGGKGAPRGAPDSFLMNVLLADQTATDAIFERSVEGDRDDTGKVKLSHAFAALAQDPLFKDVLAAAQREVDLYFTQSGRRKRGQSSKFTAAGDYVKKLDDELHRLRTQLDESAAIEEDLRQKRDERSRALERLHDAKGRLASIEAGGRLRSAQKALEDIDGELGRLDSLNASIAMLEQRVREMETEVESAESECQTAEAAVRTAEEAHWKASSDDIVREQELRRAQTNANISELATQIVGAERRKERLDEAVGARAHMARTRQAVAAAQTEADISSRERDRLGEAARALATEVELARTAVAFSRWRQAMNTVEEANQAKNEATAAIREAEENESTAAQIEAELASAEELLRKRLERLPSREQFERIHRMERELQVAEAALGGGISVMVRPAAAVTLVARVDHEEREIGEIDAPRELEAERTMHLAIADIVEIDILAGNADKRQTVEQLRRRWEEEAVPSLHGAGADTVAALQGLRDDVSAEQARIEQKRREAEQGRTKAASIRDRAALLHAKAATGAIAEELERRRQALAAHDLATVEAHYAELGNPSEAKAEAHHETLVQQHAKVAKEFSAAEQAVARASYQLADAQKRAGESERDFGDKCSAADPARLDPADLDSTVAACADTIGTLRQARAAHEKELESLTTEAKQEIAQAAQALEQANEVLQRSRKNRDAVAAARDSGRDEHAQKCGAREELREALAKLDREGAASLVERRRAELAALPDYGSDGADDEASVRRHAETAQREYDRAKEELDRKEGALSQVGGNALREEVGRIEEAHAAAQLRERELEIDADAWKLLHDTLRGVENDEDVHLGRALAGPVAERFAELTGGRYSNLRLDTGLKTEGVDAAGINTPGDVVLEFLSVGTRDQLAALIRLTIADQLRSSIVLDDHLVHSDRTRLLWFRGVLQRTAVNAQVIVLTCRAEDYVGSDELPDGAVVRDVAAGTIRTIDAARAITRYDPLPHE